MEKNITDKIVTNIDTKEIGKEQISSVEKPIVIPHTPIPPRKTKDDMPSWRRLQRRACMI